MSLKNTEAALLNNSIEEIAARLNAEGYNYYGGYPKAWTGNNIARIYFGRDYVSIRNGRVYNVRDGKARALSVGDEALEAVLAADAALTAEKEAAKAAKAEAAAENYVQGVFAFAC